MTLCKECVFQRGKDGIRTDACDRVFAGPKSNAILKGNELIGCLGGVTRKQMMEE